MISSVERTGTGTYTITWSTPFTGANDYTVLTTVGYSGVGPSTSYVCTVVNQTTTTVELLVERSDNGNQENIDVISAVAYGTGAGGAVVQKGEKGNFGGEKGQKGFQGPKGDKGLKGLKGLMPIGAANAHVAFNGATGSNFNWLNDTISYYNISDITRTDVGKFTITFDSAFSSAAYTVVSSAGGADHTNSSRSVSIVNQTATAVDIVCELDSGGNIDDVYIALLVYGTGDAGVDVVGPKGIKGIKGNFGGEKGFKGEKGEKGIDGIKGQIPAAAVTAHISFNGEAATGPITGSDIFANYGISAITKNSTGNYTVTFATPFASANSYTVTGSGGGRDFTASSRTLNPLGFTANACNFVVERSDSGAANDTPYVSVVFYGNGSNGAVDIKGEKGEIGPSGGVKGGKGQKGGKGEVGPTGPKGIAGTDGSKGDTGIPGTAVAKGDKGIDGDKGLKGIKGQEGAFDFQTSFVAFDASAGSGFSFGTGQIARNNIATVQRLSSGEYEIYWDTNYNSANYMVQTYYNDSSYNADQGSVVVTSRSAATMRIKVYFSNGNLDDNCPYISIIAMGDA